MRKLGLACVFLLVAAPAVAQGREADRKVMVMAHRGCWEGGAPEVSVAAIRACEAIEPDMVEIDVQRTRDGTLVLMHDETVDRMTNGHGAIGEMSTAEISALRLRTRDGGADASLTDEHVPTLEEGLLAAKGRFIVNLHLKLPVEREVAEVVQRLGMTGQVTTWVSGKADDPRLLTSPMRGKIRLIPIISECTDSCRASPMTEYAPYRPAGFYVIPAKTISTADAQKFVETAIASARPEGAWIMVSTLFQIDALPREERREIWRRLIDLGVNLIMTDHPDDFLDFVREGAAGRR